MGVIAVAYLTINKSNYVWFAVAAAVCGFLTFMLIGRFERLRRVHVREVPVVGRNGKATGAVDTIVIGTEDDMHLQAKKDLAKARKENGGLSLLEFLAGYGSTKMYDPESCWSATLLAAIGSRLTLILMWLLLFGVLALSRHLLSGPPKRLESVAAKETDDEAQPVSRTADHRDIEGAPDGLVGAGSVPDHITDQSHFAEREFSLREGHTVVIVKGKKSAATRSSERHDL